VLLASRGRLAEALDFFTASVHADPRYASGHYNRGLALYHLGRHAEAIDAFRETIRLDPKRRDVRYQLARALHAIGADPEARASMEEFRRLGGTPDPRFMRELATP
jgi:tetratricopeptide (TPR) repeat protein